MPKRLAGGWLLVVEWSSSPWGLVWSLDGEWSAEMGEMWECGFGPPERFSSAAFSLVGNGTLLPSHTQKSNDIYTPVLFYIVYMWKIVKKAQIRTYILVSYIEKNRIQLNNPIGQSSIYGPSLKDS